MKKINLFLFFIALSLLCGCVTQKTAIKEITYTAMQTTYKDTTVMVPLPAIKPQAKEQELFTEITDSTLQKAIGFLTNHINKDTLKIKTYALSAQAFIDANDLKLRLEILPEDTALQITLKNAIREKQTLMQRYREKELTIKRNSTITLVIASLIALCIIFYFIITGKR